LMKSWGHGVTSDVLKIAESMVQNRGKGRWGWGATKALCTARHTPSFPL
jgi:hypothetical protein